MVTKPFPLEALKKLTSCIDVGIIDLVSSNVECPDGLVGEFTLTLKYNNVRFANEKAPVNRPQNKKNKKRSNKKRS